jgi:hypothetical protein
MFNPAAIQALIRSTTTRYRRILKWDEDKHPRVPSGSGRESGRFTSAGTVQESLAVPTPTPPPVFPKAQAPVEVLRARGGPQTRQAIAAEVADVNVERVAYAKALQQGGRAYSKAPGMSRDPGMGLADYADLMNAPTGTGFGNTPRITGDREAVQRLTTPVKPPSRTLEVLKTAHIIDAEELDPGEHANDVFKVTLATLDNDEEETTAILKPEVGEAWTGSFSNDAIVANITNRQFSLAEREATAYEFAEAMGMNDDADFVPKTVARTEIDNLPEASGSDGGGGMDSYAIQEEYDAYREKALEKAMDAVGQEFGDLYYAAQTEHLEDINRRADEAAEIWNDLVEKEFADAAETTDEDFRAQRDHPVLPMGSQEPFERRVPVTLDPLELMDEAKIDVEHTMSPAERENLRAVMRQHLQDGAYELGDVDEDAAREHLDRDQWMEDHQDTENRLYDSKIQSLEAWKQSQGYGTREPGSAKNTRAPHPNGGMLQDFVEGLTPSGAMSSQERRKIAIFDYAVGSLDRHGNNVFYDGDGNLLAMDNGYAFPDSNDTTFRSDPTRRWLSWGSDAEMPEDERKPLLLAMQNTDWQAFADRHPNMSPGEREAFLERIGHLRTALETSTGLYRLWTKMSQKLMRT